ncbi:agmatinase [Leucobacter chromiireducens]|uniref:Agmatinase n=1 Tax=Leucobacter chromiireducens subsp. solipictus TaxID=398235 RepID=A0ABS1SBZ9_9MICO|nr:agmatinase [Leucobacter chromiireducens]MBL3678069.1 agmatinase [Leucobacter chromiireducens subsp. solipictus]
MSEETSVSVDETMWNGLLHGGLGGTFMGVPRVELTREAIAASGAKAVVYGFPFDATTISRSGANYGPRAIRETSVQYTNFQATFGFDLFEHLPLFDGGDCHVALGNTPKTFARVEADIAEIVAGGAIPVVFGGDHSVSIPVGNAAKKPGTSPGWVQFDTHLDSAPDVGGELLSHCCTITRAVDNGYDPAKMVLVGINGWMNPKTELQYCRDHGIRVIWLEDIWAKGTAWAVEQILERVGEEGFYLTFDIDALDAAFAPGTCAPTPGGMTIREAFEIVRGISPAGLIGLDIAEPAPSLDHSTRTQLIAGRLALEALAFHAGSPSEPIYIG